MSYNKELTKINRAPKNTPDPCMSTKDIFGMVKPGTFPKRRIDISLEKVWLQTLDKEISQKSSPVTTGRLGVAPKMQLG